MTSLVKLPNLNSTNTNIPLIFNVVMKNNIFNRTNFCGAILSTNGNNLAASGMVNSESFKFASPHYLNYATFLD